MTKPAGGSTYLLRQALAALLGFGLVAVAWTWPLAANLSAGVAHDAIDPVLNTWILWWNAQAVPFTAAWWNAPIFFPMPGALALSEHLAGIALFTTPLLWAGVPPLGVYNLALIASFALSGFFAFLLGRRLTGSVAAGLVAGLAYGFAPYRASQLSHLQVLTSQWMPLALLALHAYIEDGRARWLALLAAAWLIQALSNGYYLLFLPLLIVLWLAWFVDWRRDARRGLMLLVAWAGSSLLLVPALLQYLEVHGALGLERSIEEMQRFSARAGSFLRPARMLAFWPSRPAPTQEEFLFPGVTVVALTLAALVWTARRDGDRRTSTLGFYAGATIVMAVLALGPAAEGSGLLSIVKPYTLLAWLPGFSGLRAPARLWMLGALCLAVAAALAFRALLPARRVPAAIFTAAVFAGLTLDGWMRPMPIAAAPRRIAMPNQPNAAVIELPVDEAAVGTGAMYRSVAHRLPLINGYSGHTPRHYDILSLATSRGDPSVFTELSRGRPLIIAVHDRYDVDGRYRRLLEGLPGVRSQGAIGSGSLYVLPAAARAHVAPAGPDIAVHSMEWSDRVALVDLGSPRTVRTLAFLVRRHFAELADRLRIESSDDGVSWTTVWEDWTGGRALLGALEHAADVPLRITLPDVRARYLRISPVPRWATRGLRLTAPR